MHVTKDQGAKCDHGVELFILTIIGNRLQFLIVVTYELLVWTNQ